MDGDVEDGNFKWDHGKMRGFDFDDMGYKWFVKDIRIFV